jgi:hypothetical protein
LRQYIRPFWNISSAIHPTCAAPFAQPSLARADCQIAANRPVTGGQLGVGVGVDVRVGAGVNVLVGAGVSEGLTGTGVLVGEAGKAVAVAVAVDAKPKVRVETGGAAAMAGNVTVGPFASASALVGVGRLPNELATAITPMTTTQSKTNAVTPPMAHIVQAGRRAGCALTLTGKGTGVTSGAAG